MPYHVQKAKKQFSTINKQTSSISELKEGMGKYFLITIAAIPYKVDETVGS